MYDVWNVQFSYYMYFSRYAYACAPYLRTPHFSHFQKHHVHTSRVKCFATDDTSSVLSGFGRKPLDRKEEGHIITSLDAASVYGINLACVFRRYLQTVDRHDPWLEN